MQRQHRLMIEVGTSRPPMWNYIVRLTESRGSTCRYFIHLQGFLSDDDITRLLQGNREVGRAGFSVTPARKKPRNGFKLDIILDNFYPFSYIPDPAFLGKGIADMVHYIAVYNLDERFGKRARIMYENPEEKFLKPHLEAMGFESNRWYALPEYREILQRNVRNAELLGL